MKGLYVDRLRRMKEKKHASILKRVGKEKVREPDFLVFGSPDKVQPPSSMASCRAENTFRLADGSEISSIHELMESLKVMSPNVFEHHVSAEKNDFGRWLADVFGEKALAENLSKSSDVGEHHSIIKDHVLSDLISYARRSL